MFSTLIIIRNFINYSAPLITDNNWAPNKHIRMISEESCDTDNFSFDELLSNTLKKILIPNFVSIFYIITYNYTYYIITFICYQIHVSMFIQVSCNPQLTVKTSQDISSHYLNYTSLPHHYLPLNVSLLTSTALLLLLSLLLLTIFNSLAIHFIPT